MTILRKNLLRPALVSAAALAALAIPGGAQAQLFLNDPGFQSAPIEGSDPLV